MVFKPPPKQVVRGAARLGRYAKQASKQPGYLGSTARSVKPSAKPRVGGRVGKKPPKKR